MSKVSEVLKRHGPAVGLIDNPTQRDYADFVAAGIEAARCGGDERPGGQLFAEAETGSGKTIAYLVAAGLDCVAHGSRAIVATHTLALQRQILDRDDEGRIRPECDMAKALKIIELETGKKLDAALRIGRRNFVDARRTEAIVERMLKRKGLQEQTRDELEALSQWASSNPGGEIRSFLEDEGLDKLPAGLIAEDLCVGPHTARDDQSWQVYKQHADRATQADIVVTNHAMLVRQALTQGQPILANADDDRMLGVVIVDECDQMESVARNATSDLLPIAQMKAAIDRWHHSHEDGRGYQSAMAIARLHELMSGLREDLLPDVPEGQESVVIWDDAPQSARRAVMLAIEALGIALAPLMSSPADPEDEAENDVRDYAQTLANFWRNIKGMTNATGQTASIAALRWSPDRKYPSLRLFRLNPARVLKKVWATWGRSDQVESEGADAEMFALPARKINDPRKAKALILTSATISSPTKHGKPDITQMSEVFGIWPPTNACDALNREGKTFAPKRFGSVQIVFSDPGAPKVYLDDNTADEDGESQRTINPRWVDYILAIVRAAQLKRGRVLVLANSYPATAAICAALRRAGLDPIEKARAASQTTCVRRLVAQPDGVFVTPGSWEGFDISRHIGPDGKPAKIKHVVMTQLPFNKSDDAYGAALMRHLTINRGMSRESAVGILYGRIAAAAQRKAKQGFGRGNRGSNDHFTFWVGDVRFPRLAYFNATMRATPGVRTQHAFANIIPVRFRQSLTGDASAWERGQVLKTDGSLVEAPEEVEA